MGEFNPMGENRKYIEKHKWQKCTGNAWLESIRCAEVSMAGGRESESHGGGVNQDLRRTRTRPGPWSRKALPSESVMRWAGVTGGSKGGAAARRDSRPSTGRSIMSPISFPLPHSAARWGSSILNSGHGDLGPFPTWTSALPWRLPFKRLVPEGPFRLGPDPAGSPPHYGNGNTSSDLSFE